MYNPEKWKSLANSADTLVFICRQKILPISLNCYCAIQRNQLCHLAVIEQATTELSTNTSNHINRLRN